MMSHYNTLLSSVSYSLFCSLAKASNQRCQTIATFITWKALIFPCLEEFQIKWFTKKSKPRKCATMTTDKKWFQTKKYQWKFNWNIHKERLSTSALLDETWSRKTSNQFRKTTTPAELETMNFWFWSILTHFTPFYYQLTPMESLSNFRCGWAYVTWPNNISLEPTILVSDLWAILVKITQLSHRQYFSEINITSSQSGDMNRYLV